MKVKVNEASGAVLDWLVAKAEEPIGGYKAWVQKDFDKGVPVAGIRADDWLTVGPIIEREKINIYVSLNEWDASRDIDMLDFNKTKTGPTPLIAAMRCYCASKLGDECEVPDGLA